MAKVLDKTDKADLVIAPERASEFNEIYELVKEAFKTSEHSEGDEQDYVVTLRNSENYIAELAQTIKLSDLIIGHIMLTKTTVYRNEGNLPVLLLSPVSVHNDYRKMGVAAQLISGTLEKAKNLGYGAVLLVGEPAYYSRFGFTQTTNFGIYATGEVPEKYNLVLELDKGYLGSVGGTVQIV